MERIIAGCALLFAGGIYGWLLSRPNPQHKNLIPKIQEKWDGDTVLYWVDPKQDVA